MNGKKLLIIIVIFFASLISLLSQEGEQIGEIGSVNTATKEIIVHSPKYASKTRLGEKFYVRIGDKAAVLRATFPMQTVVKCSLEGKYAGYLGQIAKGMTVYRYVAGVEEGKTDIEPKTGTVKKIGGIEFVYIKGGEFIMGQPNPNIGGIDWSKNEQPVHKVKVSGFLISKYEVTQGQYESIMSVNPSNFKGDTNLPVEQVSWNDARNFCQKFSAKHGGKVRLPTEAEWEYACRAGTTTKYYWGDTVDGKYCWYFVNSDKKTHPVGQKIPNAWGLYDMTGNVWEWCEDWYGVYSSVEAPDPKGPSNGRDRILRGGSFNCNEHGVRSAWRVKSSPGSKVLDQGFRLVLEAK